MIARFFRRLFCPHTDIGFVFNIYGDHIIYSGYMRSCWQCSKCGKYIYSEYLHDETKEGNR